MKMAIIYMNNIVYYIYKITNLINNKIIDYNSYTGMFENKNLIVIMMESANDILNEYLV